MSMEIEKFSFEGMGVRVVVVNGEPWFVAKDVCEVLGLTWSGHTLDRIPDKHKGSVNFTTPGGNQDLICVSEAGLYKLIMRSNKPDAERFQDWFVAEDICKILGLGCVEEAVSLLAEGDKASVPVIAVADLSGSKVN